MIPKATKFVIITIFLFVIHYQNFSQSTLSPGDIAFVGFNADGEDGFTFITLTTLNAETKVNFTDKGWKNDGILRAYESIITWTSPIFNLPSGQIISIAGLSSSLGTVTGTSALNLAEEGDQILAYQQYDTISFITAIHFNGTGWETDATDTQTSKLPKDLSNNTNAISVSETDNAIFVGKFTGNRSELLSKINNPGNWFTSSSYTFNITEDDYPYNVWESTNTEWNNGSRWLTGSVPDENDHAYIKGTRDPYISTSTNAVCKKLTLAANSTLTIQSDNTGTGSLITEEVVTESGVIINTERFIPSGNWHLISSPVLGQGLDAFGSSAANSLVLYTDSEPDEYNLSSYSESTDDWTFVPVGSSGEFGKGIGYSMQRSEIGVVTFSGAGIYTGNQSVSVASGTSNGWNCIGNPYTSPINTASFLTTNASVLEPSFQFVYLWDQETDDYTQTTTGDIALGQGFFINAKVGGASVSFTPEMQVATAATFKSDKIEWPSVKLMARSNDLFNETSVIFNSQMTLGLDPGFDGGKLRGNPDIALYTKLIEDNGVDFAIQALPEIKNQAFRIPVGLDFIPGGELTFNLESNNLPKGTLVYLEDALTGIITHLNITDVKHTVTLDADTKGTERFSLLVSKNGATGVYQKNQQNQFNIFTRNNTIFIYGVTNDKTSFKLYSIDGKTWASKHASDTFNNKIDYSSFPSGIYILEIHHEGNRQSQKVILTK